MSRQSAIPLVLGMGVGLACMLLFLNLLTVADSGSSVSAHGPYAEVIDLGHLGGEYSFVKALNTSAQVVGGSYLDTSGAVNAFLWHKGRMEDLGEPLTVSTATAIDSSGDVVGWMRNASGQRKAFQYQYQTRQELHTPDGAQSAAYDINDRGQVAGEVNPGESSWACLWEDGALRDLGVPRDLSSSAHGINNRGQVVVHIETSEGDTRSSLWENGVLSELMADSEGTTKALGINDHGHVVGVRLGRVEDVGRPFLWKNGEMQLLGCLGGVHGVASSINNTGQIVGSSAVWSYTQHAFVWQDGIMHDLNELVDAPGWVFNQAVAINDAGDIAGVGQFNGQMRGFLLIDRRRGVAAMPERRVSQLWRRQQSLLPKPAL